MPVLDLKLYTTISVCVALVAFIYSCTLSFAPRWPLHIPVDNSQTQVTSSESVEYPSIPDKSSGVTSSIFQLSTRKPVGSMGPLLNSLLSFLQKEKICVMVCYFYI